MRVAVGHPRDSQRTGAARRRYICTWFPLDVHLLPYPLPESLGELWAGPRAVSAEVRGHLMAHSPHNRTHACIVCMHKHGGG